jgi:hypothetical protein
MASIHALTPLLSFRGGSDGAEVSDYLEPAIAYFNNLRVPAAVLASIVSKEMFVLQSTPPVCMRPWDEAHGMASSRSWRRLRYAYLLLMVLAFSLELSTIFFATQVSTQLATATIDSKAPSLVCFLVRDFEFEYSVVRCHFLTGLLSFTIAQALRVRYALRKYTMLSISGMCCVLTAASGMLTYTNANTITYGGFSGLLRRNLVLSMRFLMTNMRRGPMSIITIICVMLTVTFALCGWFAPEFVDVNVDYGMSDAKAIGATP